MAEPQRSAPFALARATASPLVVPARLGTFALAALIVSVAFITAMVIGPLRSVIETGDDGWLDLVSDARWGALVTVGRFFGVIGASTFTLPIRLAVLVWFAARRAWTRAGAWVIAVVTAKVTVAILKPLFDRTRPPFVETARSSSFPSGHTVTAAALGITLALLLSRPGRHRRTWLIAGGGYAIVMALSRTYTRVHWLSDVATGLVLGVTVALGAVWLARRWESQVARTTRAVFGWIPRLVDPFRDRRQRSRGSSAG